MSIKVIRNLKLTVNFINEGKRVIAYSPALDVSTVGKDRKQAQKRFEELANIFFKDIEDRGVVNEVLGGLGWIKVPKTKSSPSSWMQPDIKSTDIKIALAV